MRHLLTTTCLVALLTACVGGGGGGGVAASPGGSAEEPAPQPSRNVLFIAVDDMRVEPNAITPALDALAAESTVFTNAYTPALWCLPVRTTVMFGLSPATHQVGLREFIPEKNVPPYSDIYKNPDVRALPEFFADAGYTTGVAGKVFHFPQSSRWDVNGPPIYWSDFSNPYDDAGDGTYLVSRPLADRQVHPDQVVADWGVQFINSANGPFFLAIGFFQPHQPWIAPQWAYDLYPEVSAHEPTPGDLLDEPDIAREYAAAPLLSGRTQYEVVQEAGRAEALTRGYLAAISHTDAMVGQLLDALAASPHADNTDIVLWSDHGYHLGEKFHWRKQTFWQPTVRVPLMIRAARLPAGEDSRAVSLLDLGPTVLDLAGLDATPQFEGVSLRLGASPVEIYYRNGYATVVGSEKVIDYDVDLPGDNDRAHYNLAVDPGELENLSPPPD